MTEHLQRTAFSTSRMLDFVSEKELTLQCGYGRRDWPLVAVKELIDNALDACEEQGIPPRIHVTISEDSITVADNGTGIPADVVDRLLDFSIRVSSREAYVAPDRGAQGNALKTLVAMPFVLDGEEGRVDIVGGGQRSEIHFSVDRIAQRPVADVNRSAEEGSSVQIHWPASVEARLRASSEQLDLAPFLQVTSREELHGAYSSAMGWGAWRHEDDPEGLVQQGERIATLVADFAFLNPHLTVVLDLLGEVTETVATLPEWEKWRPSSPTAPHWYEPDHLERLVGAYITHDRQNGGERTVREFVSGFKGLTSTIKQKELLERTGLSRAPLSALLTGDERDFNHAKVNGLLEAMKALTRPVRPRALGVIGRPHLESRFADLGIREGSFEYQKVASLGDDGVPQVTEVVFAALEDEDSERRLITGVNWSAAWVNPFRTLGGYGRSLDTSLTERRFEQDRPIALLVHVAHPRVQYADRGKSTVLAR